MRNPLPLLMMAAMMIAFAGCRSEPDGGQVVLPTGGMLSQDATRGVDFGYPRSVAGGRFLLAPVSIRVDREQAEKSSVASNLSVQSSSFVDDDRRARMASEVESVPSVMTNLVIHDLETGSSYLLLDRRALITRLEYAEQKQVPQIPDYLLRNLTAEQAIRLAQYLEGDDWPQELLIVGIVGRDTNGDGVLSGDDATVAHAVDLRDRSLRRLTSETLDWWQLDRLPGGLALLHAVADMNGDGRFEPWDRTTEGPDDERRYYLVNLNAPAAATPIVPEDIRQQVLRTAGISTTRPTARHD